MLRNEPRSCRDPSAPGWRRHRLHSLHLFQVGQQPLGQVPLPGLKAGTVPPYPGLQLGQVVLPGRHAHEPLGAEVLQQLAHGGLLALHHLLHKLPLEVLGDEVGPCAVCRDTGMAGPTCPVAAAARGKGRRDLYHPREQKGWPPRTSPSPTVPFALLTKFKGDSRGDWHPQNLLRTENGVKGRDRVVVGSRERSPGAH